MELNPKEEAVLNLIEEDSAYENYFFKKASDIKWFEPLKGKAFFTPKRAPTPRPADQEGYFIIPEWNVLPYLERVSQQVSLPGNEKYIDDLIAIIKDVSNYKDASGQHIDNYRTWYYFAKILLNLPNEKITEEIINLIPIWLDSKFSTSLPGAEIAGKLLPKFLNSDKPEDWKKAERLIEIITDIKWFPLPEAQRNIHERDIEARTLIEPHWLLKAFKENAARIGEKCTGKVIVVIAERLNKVLEKQRDSQVQDSEPADYSFIWFPSLYFPPTIGESRTEVVLVNILRDVLLAKAKQDVAQTKAILSIFLSGKHKYPLFKRLVLFIVGREWNLYKDIFLGMISKDKGTDYFNYPDFKPEVHELLKLNHNKFTTAEKDIIKQILQEGPQRILTEEDREKHMAHWKQKWYFPLKSDPEFNALYEEQRKIIEIPEEEIRPEAVTFRSSSGPGLSPLSIEEMLSLSNEDLATRMKEFKSEKKWEGKTVAGFSVALKEAVKTTPNKFIENLNSFKDAGFIYVYKILDGLKDAWKEKKTIDWGKVLDFITSYIEKDKFWKDEHIVEKGEWLGGANHEWVIGIIAELIQEGTRDDAWAFPEEHFDKAKEIIFTLLREPEEDKDITDYVTYTLNTPCGKLITALVYLALRIARINDKKDIKREQRWLEEYRNKFDELLDKKVIEAYTSLGHFLPNLSYLDKKWVEDKIKIMSSGKGSKYWEAFMDGYFSFGRVYDDLYDLMKPHYEYGLIYDFKQRHNGEHLIQHICIGYLRGHERLDVSDSLFRKIIDAWKPEQILEVIGFFWMQRDYLRESTEENEKMKGKIIEFWRQLHEKYKDKAEASLTQEDKHLLSSTSKLAALLPQIDAESYKWLMLSAPYVHEDYNSSFFIEYLDELKDKGDRSETAKYIGDIYLKMLDKITPDYDQEHIRSIVEFLYNAGAEESANKICNIYGSRGQEFLRDIYEKYSNKT